MKRSRVSQLELKRRLMHQNNSVSVIDELFEEAKDNLDRELNDLKP